MTALLQPSVELFLASLGRRLLDWVDNSVAQEMGRSKDGWAPVAASQQVRAGTCGGITARLPARLPACLPACQPACLLPALLMPACLPAHLPAGLSSRLLACLSHACLPAC